MDNVVRHRQSTIRAAFALSVTHWTSLAIEMSLLAYISKDLGIDDVRFGYLITTMAIAQLVTSPFYSRWAAKDLKQAVTIAFLSSSASYFLTTLSNGFWLLLASRIANAFGHGPVAVQTAVAASTKPVERTAVFGKLGATIGLGFILGPVVGGVSARTIGLRAPVFMAGVVCAIAAFVGPWFLKVGTQDPDKKHTDEPPHSQGVQGYFRLMSSKKVATILSAKILCNTPCTVMLSIFGLYLIEQFNLKPGGDASLTAYFGLCTMAMNAGGISFLKKRSGDRGLLLGGVLTFAVTGISLMIARKFYHFFLVMTVFAIGMSLVGSSTEGMLTASVREADHALVLGLAWAVDSLTRVVAPTLAGYMLTRLGFVSFGLMQLVGSLSAAVLVYLLV